MKNIILAIFALMMSACSAKFEFGYHGKTGRDDRVISEDIMKVPSQNRGVSQRY